MQTHALILLFALTTAALTGLAAEDRGHRPALDLKELAEPLRGLKAEEQKILDEAVQLIQRKEHSLALVSLARLVEVNPRNSGFRVLKAYVLLQLGNLLGALDDPGWPKESPRLPPTSACFWPGSRTWPEIRNSAGGRSITWRHIPLMVRRLKNYAAIWERAKRNVRVRASAFCFWKDRFQLL